jgi:hypothetical protein
MAESLQRLLKEILPFSYKYGADGLRTQKTVGNTVYDYYYIDGLLVRQTWGTNYMDFLYDERGYSCSTSRSIAHTDYTKFQRFFISAV